MTSASLAAGFAAVASGTTTPQHPAGAAPPRADEFLVVDCLLPGQVRRLGRRTTYLSARRPARLPARDCEIRGGEYVEYDRADWRSALGAWLPRAQQGDNDARVIVGEIYERGLGVTPDYTEAARWYRLAAEQGDARAQVNLGHLYERGLGGSPDPRAALEWYRRAAGLPAAIDLEPASLAPRAATAVPPDRSAEITALETELERRSGELARLTRELEQANTERQKSERALQSALESALKSASDASDSAESTAAADRQRLAAAHTNIERLQSRLDTQQLDMKRLRDELDSARHGASEAAALAESRQAELVALQRPMQERLLAGPEVVLITPQLASTRDIVRVASVAAGESQIVGRVSAPAGAIAVTVNDAPVDMNELGVFTRRLPVPAGETPVSIVVVDRQGKRAELQFMLRAAATTLGGAPDAEQEPALQHQPGVNFGRYHLLAIGNNDYQSLPDLASPINDATEVARILGQRYRFRTQVLTNATRYQILSTLNALRETLTPEDNLVVYYAGHGELDEVNQRGHWLPVDAERGSTANWIPTTAITDLLNIMRARQVLLIADSCYAGALTRSSMGRLRAGMTDAERLHWYRTMASKRSRTVLTSGGIAPVLDAGAAQHSVFARALLDVLAANDGILDGQRLHREVAARVAYAAATLRFDQVPEYAPIRFAGHEAGDFFLVPGG